MGSPPPRNLRHQLEFSDRRPEIGLQRYPVHRNVPDLAMDDLTVGAGEFGKTLLIGAPMAPQQTVISRRLVEKQNELFGGTLALGRGADKGQPEAGLIAAHDIALEAAETVQIQHHGRTQLWHDLAGDRHASR